MARRPRPWVLVAAGAALVVAIVAVVVWARGGDGFAEFEVTSNDGTVTHEYVIPDGTAARIASGQTVEVVPEFLHAKVGDTLRIRNDDTEQATVGIFYVTPGQTVTMRFTEPGRLEGLCDVHPSGKFVIDVAA